MSKPQKTIEDKKSELINNLIAARDSILKNAQSLPERCQDEMFLGTWSVKDLLAHLSGWDFTNLQAIREILSGVYPTFFKFYDKDWQSYNQCLVNQYRKETWEELLGEVKDSHHQLVSYLHNLTPEDITAGKIRSERGRTVTIRNLLISEASDELTHAQQIASYRDKQDSILSPSELTI